MQKNRFSVADMARLAIVAGLYAALTLAIPGMGFLAIQFRISELLVLLCFYRRDYCIALILGCFVANCFSPMALADMIFGTLGTAIAVIPMFSIKNIWVASLLPVISNGIIIGLELWLIYGEPLWLSMATVALGELGVITIIGCPLFRFVLEKNSPFMKAIKANKPTIK